MVKLFGGKERPRAQEIKEVAGLHIGVSDESEQRRNAVATLKEIMIQPLSLEKPSETITELQSRLNSIVWFLREQTKPYLRARDSAKFAILWRCWEDIVGLFTSYLEELGELVEEMESADTSPKFSEEEERLLRTRRIRTAKGTVRQWISIIDREVYNRAMAIAAQGWGDSDVTAKTVYQIQTPVIIGSKYGGGEGLNKIEEPSRDY